MQGDETLLVSVEADTSAFDRSLGDLTAKANAFGSAMTGALKGAVGGGRSLDGVLRQLGLRISSIALDAALKPLGNLAGGLVGQLVSGIGGRLGAAGGASGGQGIVPFAKGGIVRSPTFFPAGRQMGLMGEAGAEAILPLKRGPGGELGVAAAGGGARGGASIVFNVTSPDAASFRRSEVQIQAMLARAAARGQRGLEMTISSFSEERFPLSVAFGTSGGPERQTEIVRLSTGYESRNQRHRHSARRYDAGSGVRSLKDLTAVLAFFEARRGRLVAFRFRDPLDWHSAGHGEAIAALDQHIGTGDGMTRAFPLAKTYGAGGDAYRRPIEKPVAGTVRVAVDGFDATDFEVDATTGMVTLAEPAPVDANVTAGFAFDVPVRFDIDHLSVNLAAFEAGDIPSIPLLEVRP